MVANTYSMQQQLNCLAAHAQTIKSLHNTSVQMSVIYSKLFIDKCIAVVDP